MGVLKCWNSGTSTDFRSMDFFFIIVFGVSFVSLVYRQLLFLFLLLIVVVIVVGDALTAVVKVFFKSIICYLSCFVAYDYFPE